MERGSIKRAAKIAFTVSLLAFILYRAGPLGVIRILLEVDIVLFGVASALVLVGVVISSVRWRVLLQSLGYDIPLRTVFKVYYFSAFANLGLPSNIGGDAVKGHLMASSLQQNMDSYSSVVVDRFLGLLALVSISSVGVFLTKIELPALVEMVLITGTIGLLTATGYLLAKSPPNGPTRQVPGITTSILPERILKKYIEFLGSLRDFRSARRVLVYGFCLSILFQTVSICALYIVSLSLGLNVPFLYLFVSIPLIQLLLAIPITINGYGASEVIYVVLFTPVGLSEGQAVGFSIAGTVLVFFTYLGGGAIGIVDGERGPEHQKH